MSKRVTALAFKQVDLIGKHGAFDAASRLNGAFTQSKFIQLKAHNLEYSLVTRLCLPPFMKITITIN